MDYSRKRVSAIARERKELLRNAFMNRIADIAPNPEMLMFTDESAKDERTQTRRHGWAPRNTRCVSQVHFVRGQRYSILPLLTLDGIVAHDIIEGSVTADRFLEFLRDMVVSPALFFLLVSILTQLQIPLTNPYPGPRSVLILDNCAIHHSDAIRELVEEEASEFIFHLFFLYL